MTTEKTELSLDQYVRGRMLVFAMAGVILASAAMMVARYFELGGHIGMDFQGERITGSAEPNGDGSYRLRYESAEGIHARTYRGGFGMQQIEDVPFEVQIVRDPERPNRFQPAGLSYLPGVLSLIIFGAGMVCILHARRIVILHRRHKNKS